MIGGQIVVNPDKDRLFISSHDRRARAHSVVAPQCRRSRQIRVERVLELLSMQFVELLWHEIRVALVSCWIWGRHQLGGGLKYRGDWKGLDERPCRRTYRYRDISETNLLLAQLCVGTRP